MINISGAVRAADRGANRLDFNGALSLAAAGIGGSADASGGAGFGGTLRLTASDGTIVNSLTAFDMAANGLGGAQVGSGAGNGGEGIGGDVQIGAFSGAAGTRARM